MAARAASLWPREHGAYAQLGVALASALALAPQPRALAQALLTAALFLASEPALVLMGRRGRPEVPARAWRRLALLGALAGLSAPAAWTGAPAALAVSMLPAALLGLGLFGLFLAGRERTAAGEVLAAWTFAAATLPVVLAGAAPPAKAVLLAVILAALFSLGTAIVHGHLFALRRGGMAAPRLGAFLLGAAITAAAGLAPLPRFAFAAFLPMTLAALGIWLFPPAPRRLKQVGWTAAGCALAGGLLAAAILSVAK